MKNNMIKMEALESRVLLAGDAIASIENGILAITGDHRGNDITVDVALDTITVTGGGGTSINGDNLPVVFNLAELLTPLKRIQVNLKHGNNTFDFNGGGMAFTSAQVIAGKGNNEINFTDIDVNGNFNIFAGKGSNDITTDTVSARALQVKTGKGSDVLTVIDTAVNGKFMVLSGKGADLVVLDGLTASSGIIRGDGEATVSIIGTAPARLNIKGITVLNSLPEIDNENALDDFTVLAGSLNGTVVGTVLASDADLNVLTYQLESTVFAIDGSGVITVADEINLGGSGTIYNLPVTVSDWQGAVESTVVITVV